MKSLLGRSARKPKPSPLEGSGNFRVQPADFNPQRISRHEWWLWFSALLVTVLSAVAFLLSSIHSFFRHADSFYEIRSDQARWATLCLVLLFNAWLVYRQWSFRRLRRQSSEPPIDWQTLPQQSSEAAGLDSVTPDYEIPLKYGVDQCIGDTIGPGGIFKALRTGPAWLDIVADVERLAPGAIVMNYTNPMSILTLAASRTSRGCIPASVAALCLLVM